MIDEDLTQSQDAIPGRIFVHDGVRYQLHGNRETCMSHFHEVRAHHSLIKLQNVNRLPQVFGSKEFDDGTAATHQIVNGIEDVTISAPIIEVEEEPNPQSIRTEIEQVVPVMRSACNQYWVASLDGTFEEPYYLFRNINDIPAEAFDDDIEADMDGQEISEGADYIEDGVTAPLLYFVAQTGARDTGSRDDDSDTSVYGDQRFQVETDDSYTDNTTAKLWDDFRLTCSGYWQECLGEAPRPCVAVYPIDYTYDQTFYRDITFSGDTIDIGPTKLRFRQQLSGLAGIALSDGYINGGEGGCAAKEPPTYLLIIDYESGLNKDTDIASFFGSAVHVWDYSMIFPKAISIEEENTGLFACHYCDQVFDETDNFSTGDPSCFDLAASREIPWDYNVEYLRKYSFQVSSNSYVFYEPPTFTGFADGYSDIYKERYGSDEDGALQHRCLSRSNMIKYYGPDSKGKDCGIMCGVAESFTLGEDGYETDNSYLGFYYNYIGPNTENDISTKLFIPEDTNQKEHIIANVAGLDDSVVFKGEVFLGVIKYDIEVKIA